MSNLSKQADEYLACRDIRHAWKTITDFVDYKDGKKVVSVIRSLKCIRCGTVRYDEYSYPQMNLVRKYYSYPQDYHIPGGRIPANVIRKELYLRTKRRK